MWANSGKATEDESDNESDNESDSARVTRRSQSDSRKRDQRAVIKGVEAELENGI